MNINRQHVALTCMCIVSVAVSTATVVVNVPGQGEIGGYAVRLPQTGDTVLIFHGVPYAAPPVGSLRFAAPAPRAPWTGRRNATIRGPACPQVTSQLTTQLHITRPTQVPGCDMVSAILAPDTTYSENCLTLDIYRPWTGRPERHAVMVFMHGGANQCGGAAAYDARHLAGLQGVVVAVIQYRLNALGFLTARGSSARGNWGALDQLAALRWVQRHARLFDGDPAKVTVFGNSAGGSGSGLMAISPLAKGLVHRVIAQSGNAGSPWAYVPEQYDVDKATRLLANQMGCKNITVVLSCLRSKHAMELSAAASSLPLRWDVSPWNPVVDGSGGFLPRPPLELLRGENANHVDVMVGATRTEDGRFFELVGIDASEGVTEGVFREHISNLVNSMRFKSHNDTTTNKRPIKNAITHEYYPYEARTNEPPSFQRNTEFRDNYYRVKQWRDYMGPAYEQAMHANKYSNSSYVYVLDYKSPSSPSLPWHGVPHNEDLIYIYGFPISGRMPWQNLTIPILPPNIPSWNELDKDVARTVMQLWTNFAKTGHPTPHGTALPPTMSEPAQPFTSFAFNVLHIDGPVTQSRPDYDVRRAAFWLTYIPQVVEEAACPGPRPSAGSAPATTSVWVTMTTLTLTVIRTA